jgi:hypothetical protein
VIIAPDDAAVTSFEDLALALRRVGRLAANKVAAFVDNFELTEISEAVALSRIMVDAVTIAAELDEGVLTRLRIDSERRTIEGKVVPAPAAQSHANSVVAMSTRKPVEPKCLRPDLLILGITVRLCAPRAVNGGFKVPKAAATCRPSRFLRPDCSCLRCVT